MNAVTMSGNKYVNYIVVAAVEIPGFWTAVLLLDRIGRKPLLCCAFWTCAACQIGFIFMTKDYYKPSLAVYLVGKYSISIVTTCVYVYTNELFPTQYRGSLFAFASMIGRIGGITAPLTPALGTMVWKHLPFVLFGSFAALSGLLVLLAPDTKGTTLPDTMQQAADLGSPWNAPKHLPFVLFGSFAALSGLLVLLAPETKGTTLPDTMQQAADLGRSKKPSQS